MIHRSPDSTSLRSLAVLVVATVSMGIAAEARGAGRLRLELLLNGLECLKTTSGLGNDDVYVISATANLADARMFCDFAFYTKIGSDEYQATTKDNRGIGGFWPVDDVDDVVILFLVAERDIGSGGQSIGMTKDIERAFRNLLTKLRHQYVVQKRPRDEVVAQLVDAVEKAWATRAKKQDDLIAITELRLMSEDVSTTDIKKKLKRHPAIGDGGAFALHVQITSGPFEHGSPDNQGPGQPPAKRNHWVHSAGSFRMVGGNKWNEYDANGNLKFSYVETQRNDQFVELYDASREGFARLLDGKAMGKHPLLSGNQWVEVLQGSWKNPQGGNSGGPGGGSGPGGQPGQLARTHWAYAGGFFRKTGGNNWDEPTNGKLHATFVEQERNAEYVQLYNAKRSLWVRLTDTSGHLFDGFNRDKGWHQFQDGKWSK